MVKPRVPDLSQADWFLPATSVKGSVRDSLEAVVRAEQQRLALVVALKHNLCTYASRSSDSFVELRRRIKELEDTLNFRLPLISFERSGGWFREYVYRGVGPFPTSVLTEPIFRAYESQALVRLRSAIEQAYRNRAIVALPFSEPGPCLWLTLLSLNQALEHITILPPPFKGLRLDKLPDDLPADFDSQTLHEFLTNVKASALAARQEMDRVFALLWQASAKFWDRAPRRPQRSGASRAEELRGHFRERRRSLNGAPKYSLNDLSALRFMKLATMPTTTELKRRYLELARQYHPDRQGGNEDQFKALAKAYQYLSSKIQSK